MKKTPLDPKSIPSDLHALCSWINWTLLPNGNKSPVDRYGKAVGYNNTDAWLPMMDAIQNVRNNPMLQLGISLTHNGLKVGDWYLWCLDLDGFVCEDLVDDGVLELLEKASSWSEVSPSETGIKIFLLSDKPPTTFEPIKFGPSKFAVGNPTVKKYQNRAIEVFSWRRFLAVTGDCIAGKADGFPKLRFIPANELDTLLNELNQWAISTSGSGWSKLPKQPLGKLENSETSKDYAKPVLQDMKKVLLYVDADDEQVWSNTLNGIARTYGEDGRRLAHDYSKRSDKYDEAVCDARYERALEELGRHPTGLTAWSIIKEAKGHPDWPQGFEIRYEECQPVDEVNPTAPTIKSPNQHIAEINEKYAWDQKRLEIYSREARRYVNQSGFKTNYRTVSIPVGKNAFQSLGEYWLSSKKRLEVKGTRLAPDEGPITTAGEINTWLGYSCKPVEGDIQPFLDVFCHLLTNQDNRDYVMSFCAKLIQSPATRFNVALGIFGEAQGTGKNSIFEAVGGLLHEHHFKVISGAELDSPFDDWQIDKVFVVGDEVSNSGERTKADKLKRLVTATNNNINPKGFPGFSQPNLIKYVFLSNHDQILHIGEHDRRYYIAKTTDEKLPAKVADKFYAWKSAGGLAHLLNYMLNYDCSGFDPTKEAPMTEAKAEVIDAGKSSLELWVERYTSKLNTQGKKLITTDDVVTQYRVTQNQFATPKAAGNALNKAGAKKLAKRAQLATGERIRVFAMANFEHLKGLSERELGSIWEGENR